MKAINLKTEYLTNPIGIDVTEPRFSWNCEGGIRQSAYQIISPFHRWWCQILKKQHEREKKK